MITISSVDMTANCIEASTIGLKPGQWPQAVLVQFPDGKTIQCNFVRSVADLDNDLVYVVYAHNQYQIQVFND